jgi:predicted esterase
MNTDPHKDSPVLRRGTPLEEAVGAIILLHGRGGSAEDILSLTPELRVPGVAFLAPEASGNTWYPHSFLAPKSENEPWLSSALHKVETTLQLLNDGGVAANKIVVCGFSQGACLATEFVATHPRRYGGLVAFTGGLIGPPDAELIYQGDLAGTPAFFGAADRDPHVPWTRVQQSAEILTRMGGSVTVRSYPRTAHTISPDELAAGAKLIRDALSR